MNKVILVGRVSLPKLIDAPILANTNQGVPTCSFSIAVQRNFVSQQTGQREADFINCVAYREKAEFVCKNFRKGSPIAIEGRLATRNYTDKTTGKTIYVTEVMVDSVYFVPQTKADNAQQDDQNNGYQGGYQNNGYQNNGYQNNGYQNNSYQGGYQNNSYQGGYQNNSYPNGGMNNQFAQNQQIPGAGFQNEDAYSGLEDDVEDGSELM